MNIFVKKCNNSETVSNRNTTKCVRQSRKRKQIRWRRNRKNRSKTI